MVTGRWWSGKGARTRSGASVMDWAPGTWCPRLAASGWELKLSQSSSSCRTSACRPLAGTRSEACELQRRERVRGYEAARRVGTEALAVDRSREFKKANPGQKKSGRRD